MIKKYLIAVAATALVGIPLYFTLKTNEVEDKTTELRKKHAEFLANSPFKKTQQLTKTERRAIGMPPNKFHEREWELTMNPNIGRPTPELGFQLNEELNAKIVANGVPGDTGNEWVERGPNNIGGRVRAILFDPSDSSNKRVIAGGVSGGIWINDDISSSTSSWKQATGVPSNLSVTCITADPNNPKVMYIGTGEVYTWGTISGNGVYKSEDSGNTWTHIYGGNEPNIQDKIAFIQDIIAWNNPNTNKTELFFGVDSMIYIDDKTYQVWIGENAIGLYKSTDDGKTFNKIDLGESFAVPPNNFDVDAGGTLWMGTKSFYKTLAAGEANNGGGLIFSTQDGSTWTKAATSFAESGRVQIAASKTTANKVYALIEGHNQRLSKTAPPVKIVGTTNGFNSVSNKKLPGAPDGSIPRNDFTRGQNFYNLEIAIDPNNDNTIYVGGIDLFKSTSGGSNWTPISDWRPSGGSSYQFVHADHHAIVFGNGSSSTMAFGNDGGIYYSSNGGTNISKRNKDLNITQFYWGNISKHTTSSEKLLAGAQDNGSLLISSGQGASEIYGGDGGYTFIDADGKYMISSYVYNNHKYHDYNGNFRYLIDSDVSRDGLRDGDFINQATLDSENDILYANGTSGGTTFQIYKYKLGTSNDTKSTLKNSKLTAAPIVFKVSPFNASKLFVGTVDSKILRIDGASGNSQTWTDISGNQFVGSVSGIEFGETENDIMVTFHNWGVKSVWYSNDGGSTWMDKEGDLPDIPVKCILQNPLRRSEVIIGTELGVWVTRNFDDASPKWSRAYNGMMDVKVLSFDFRASDNTVLATTFGRGMFTGKFNDTDMSVTENDFLSSNLTLFPTVSTGNFNLNTKNLDGDLRITVYTLDGKNVYNNTLSLSKNQTNAINLTGNASGMYIVRLATENANITRRVIIK